METALAVLTIIVMVLALGLHIFGLPANWVVLGIAGLWKWLHPDAAAMNLTFFIIIGGLALAGEILEFGVQMLGARRYGGTGRGTLGGFIGGIAGAILGAPFFLGLGALLGALGGAYLGCLVMELGLGRSGDEARRAAMGTFIGRFLGLSLKFGLGVWMVSMTIPRLWG